MLAAVLAAELSHERKAAQSVTHPESSRCKSELGDPDTDAPSASPLRKVAAGETHNVSLANGFSGPATAAPQQSALAPLLPPLPSEAIPEEAQQRARRVPLQHGPVPEQGQGLRNALFLPPASEQAQRTHAAQAGAEATIAQAQLGEEMLEVQEPATSEDPRASPCKHLQPQTALAALTARRKPPQLQPQDWKRGVVGAPGNSTPPVANVGARGLILDLVDLQGDLDGDLSSRQQGVVGTASLATHEGTGGHLAGVSTGQRRESAVRGPSSPERLEEVMDAVGDGDGDGFAGGGTAAMDDDVVCPRNSKPEGEDVPTPEVVSSEGAPLCRNSVSQGSDWAGLAGADACVCLSAPPSPACAHEDAKVGQVYWTIVLLLEGTVAWFSAWV